MKKKKFSANLPENDPKRAKIDDPVSLLGCYQKLCEIFKIKFEPEEMREVVDQYEEKHLTEDQDLKLINFLR